MDITPDGAVPEGSSVQPFGVHDDAVGQVAEGRWYASRYLSGVAGYEPKVASLLLQAASCDAREHELMWDVWACVGGNGRTPEHVRRFADPAVRRWLIEIVLEARRQDERAIEQIEAALRELGTTG